MPVGGYGLCRLLPTRPIATASYPVLVYRIAALLQASFRPRLAATRQYEVLATRLQCEFSAANQIENLWASGPGWFRGALQAGDSQRVEASWGKELILRPHGSEQLLSLVGSPTEMAQIQASDQGSISAAEIHIWLSETTPQPNAPSQQRGTGLSASSKSRAVRPSRMRAEGDVRFDSSQLGGATNRLEVWIQAPQRSHGDAAAGDMTGGHTVTRIDRFENVQGSPWTRAVTTEGSRGQKYHVLGERMRVLFIQGHDGLQLDDVSVNGHAELSEIRSGPTGQLPLKMTGDVFHLRRASSADLAATVRGRPATVQSQGMGLSGGTIELDRAAQRVWIDGPGEATLPMSHDLSGKPSSRPQVANIAWRDGMDFRTFKASINHDAPPQGIGPALQALWRQAKPYLKLLSRLRGSVHVSDR